MSVSTGKTSKTSKKGQKVSLSSNGTIVINASFNNTMITCMNAKNQTVAWQSGGSANFKNSRKSTSEAAEVAAKKLGVELKQRGMSSVFVKIQGVGQGREGAVRGLVASGLNVSHLKDITRIAHNGCRRKKKLRK